MSHTNLITINSTEINNLGAFRVGDDLTSGTTGQVLKSQGDNLAPAWANDTDTQLNLTAALPVVINDLGGLNREVSLDIDTATMGVSGGELEVLKVPNALTFTGTSTGTYDGSSPLSINLSGTTLTPGSGIDITGTTISTKPSLPLSNAAGNIVLNYLSGQGGLVVSAGQLVFNPDTTTIGIDGSAPHQVKVLKVPNALTFTGTSTGTYDGSSALSINLTNSDTQLNLTAALPVIINNGGGLNREVELQYDSNTLGAGGGALEVLKVPNTLTFTGTATGTYDGSSALSINLTDTDTTYQGSSTININTATNPDTINCLKVPNVMTAGTNISMVNTDDGASATTYDGSEPITITAASSGTTYDGGTNINIDTSTTPDEINLDTSITGQTGITFLNSGASTNLTGSNYPGKPTTATNLDLTSSTNIFPLFVSGEVLKSISYIDNSTQNFNRIYNTANEFFFSGSQDSGSDTLEIDFTATSTTGYCEYGFYANSLNPGLVFCVGIAAATGGTSPLSTTLTSSPVAIDAYKLGLFDGTTTAYSLKEILDFTSYENTYITSKFFFNNLSVGTRYRMSLYGRCFSSGSIYINSGGKNTTGYATRSAHQPTFMKFYEYDSAMGGSRTTGGGGGGGGGK